MKAFLTRPFANTVKFSSVGSWLSFFRREAGSKNPDVLEVGKRINKQLNPG